MIIVAIKNHRQVELLEIAQALGLDRFGLGVAESRQEQRRQDRDDRNHHQQFDQCKCESAALRKELQPPLWHRLSHNWRVTIQFPCVDWQ